MLDVSYVRLRLPSQRNYTSYTKVFSEIIPKWPSFFSKSSFIARCFITEVCQNVSIECGSVKERFGPRWFVVAAFRVVQGAH